MRLFSFVVTILLTFALTTAFAGNLYIWVDKDGVKHFSQTPPTSEQKNQPKVRQGKFDDFDHYSLEAEKVSLSNDEKNCEPEPEAGWDNAELKDINEYYDYRVEKCKVMYGQDPKVMEGCQKEQADIKSRKMKSYQMALKNRCKKE